MRIRHRVEKTDVQQEDQLDRREWYLAIACGILAVIVVFAVGANFIQGWKGLDQGKETLTAQFNNHQSTIKKDNEIKALSARSVTLLMEVKASQADHAATLTEIKDLATAVNSVISQLPAADAFILGQEGGLDKQVLALCAATHADCPPLPK